MLTALQINGGSIAAKVDFGYSLFEKQVAVDAVFQPNEMIDTIAITKGTALGSVVAVSEILGQASSAVSNSYNPSPLMLGAAAYLVLFIPVVVAGRWVETRFAWKR
jgi:ABC-type amino acid transport system permease subunit